MPTTAATGSITSSPIIADDTRHGTTTRKRYPVDQSTVVEEFTNFVLMNRILVKQGWKSMAAMASPVAAVPASSIPSPPPSAIALRDLPLTAPTPPVLTPRTSSPTNTLPGFLMEKEGLNPVSIVEATWLSAELSGQQYVHIMGLMTATPSIVLLSSRRDDAVDEGR